MDLLKRDTGRASAEELKVCMLDGSVWHDIAQGDSQWWPVISETSRFANAPFANVSSRFAYETKRVLRMYIPRL